MNNVPYMDLDRQYHEHRDGILQAITDVCEASAYVGGNWNELFEQKFADFCDVKYCTGVSNGTNALFASMKALGIGPGDEVIVPANTFIATAWGPTHAGARPVFVDCTSNTWEIDADKIEERITPHTKGIIGVHLYGQPFDVDRVRKIAESHGLFVVEDCAQACGAQYKDKHVGSLGDLACFSFYPTKNLGTCGEGGAVLSNNKSYIDFIDILKNQGSKERYYHEMIGYNMRLEGINASVLNYKLPYLNGWNDRRKAIAHRYLTEINNPLIRMQEQPSWAKSVFHLFVVVTEDRDAFIHHLDKNQVGYAFHYPVPCHLQKAYAYLGYQVGDCPNAEYLAEHCVSIPMFPEMSDPEVSRVIEICNAYRS